MKIFARLRRRVASDPRASRSSVARPPRPGAPAPDQLVDSAEEARLWAILREDPNNLEAFPQLADMVRRRAGAGHVGGDPRRAADDAVWALAEELAHNGHAWYPLIELARLSIHDDREAALRRLSTAAERDHSGRALAIGLDMLREQRLPGDALGLGLGHWRPREHDVETGRHLVLAAVEAGRTADARRHLAALGQHPDQNRVQPLLIELDRLIAASESGRSPQSRRGHSRPTGPDDADPTDRVPDDDGPAGWGGRPGVIDLRETGRGAAMLKAFRRR